MTEADKPKTSTFNKDVKALIDQWHETGNQQHLEDVSTKVLAMAERMAYRVGVAKIPNDAPDIIQEASSTFMRHVTDGTLELNNNPQGYLGSIIRARILDAYRRNNRLSSRNTTLDSDISRPEQSSYIDSRGISESRPDQWAKERAMKRNGTPFDDDETLYLNRAIDKMPAKHAELARLFLFEEPDSFRAKATLKLDKGASAVKGITQRMKYDLLDGLASTRKQYYDAGKSGDAEAVDDLIDKVTGLYFRSKPNSSVAL